MGDGVLYEWKKYRVVNWTRKYIIKQFVDPLMAHSKNPRRVMIIGGGEGAMASRGVKMAACRVRRYV